MRIAPRCTLTCRSRVVAGLLRCVSVAAPQTGTLAMRRAATLACLLTLLLLAACSREAPPTDAATTPASEPAPWVNEPSELRIEADVRKLADDAMVRSEAQTSEPQSLMRRSYAVF